MTTGLFKTAEEEQEFLDNIYTEYSFSCNHEKNPEGCNLLGDFYIAFKKDYKSAAKVYTKNCEENNYPRSCYLSGSNYLVGKGVEKNKDKALEHFCKACDLGQERGCLMSGAILTQLGGSSITETNKNDYLKGLKYLVKGCLAKNGLSCTILSTIYETGVAGFVEKDMAKALEFSVKACDLNVGNGCINASRWYRKGVGAPKNDMLADIYKAKGQEINRQVKSQGIEMQQYT